MRGPVGKGGGWLSARVQRPSLFSSMQISALPPVSGPMWQRQHARSGWRLQFCRRANQANPPIDAGGTQPAASTAHPSQHRPKTIRLPGQGVLAAAGILMPVPMRGKPGATVSSFLGGCQPCGPPNFCPQSPSGSSCPDQGLEMPPHGKGRGIHRERADETCRPSLRAWRNHLYRANS
jgi:hypothetical protein